MSRELRHTIRCISLLVVFCASATPALSQSFDCKKASRPIEHAICDDKSVADMDAELAAKYQAALVTHSTNRLELISAERRWTSHRDARCLPYINDFAQLDDCLRAAYGGRLRAIAKGKFSDMRAISTATSYAQVAYAAMAPSPADINHAVIAMLTSQGVKQPVIITHIDLTKPFDTASQWTLVVGRDDQPPPEAELAGLEKHGPITVCFVKALVPDCSAEFYPHTSDDPSFNKPFDLLDSRVVHAGARANNPMLLLKLCSAISGDGNCGVATVLYRYDRHADQYYRAFFNVTGHNNNEDTRFMVSGPLLGAVIVDYPTNDAPYTYWIEVYRPGTSGRYVRVLRYRGHTRYGDGNHLAVSDSEMPEILRHMGLWLPGDPLPAPKGCRHPVLRRGEEWCDMIL